MAQAGRVVGLRERHRAVHLQSPTRDYGLDVVRGWPALGLLTARAVGGQRFPSAA